MLCSDNRAIEVEGILVIERTIIPWLLMVSENGLMLDDVMFGVYLSYGLETLMYVGEKVDAMAFRPSVKFICCLLIVLA